MQLTATRVLTSICALSLFALRAIAQDTGNSTTGSATPAATTSSQFVFVPLGNNISFGSTDRRMSEYKINSSTGTLTVVNKAIKAQNIATFTFRDPHHRFLYVDGAARGSNFTFNVISGYTANQSTGAITPVPRSPFNFNNEELAFGVIRPDLRFAYIEDFHSPAIVHIISMNPSTGALVRQVATLNIPIGQTASFLFDLRFDPTGKFLYIADGEANMIDAYVSNAITGKLTEVRGAPFTPRGSTPGQCSPRQNFCGGAVAITGNHLYYVSQLYNGVAEFEIDPSTGALAELPSSPASVSGHPGFAVRVAPNGKHLYVNAPSAGTTGVILGYSINTATGKLTKVAGSPVAVSGQNFFMDIDETGKFLYTATGQAISGFHINSTSGVLTKVPGSPFSAPGNTGLTIIH